MSTGQQPADQSPIPLEYAGKWIAWDHDRTKIIASGRSFAETDDAARATGESDPFLEKVPDAKVRFIGGAV